LPFSNGYVDYFQPHLGRFFNIFYRRKLARHNVGWSLDGKEISGSVHRIGLVVLEQGAGKSPTLHAQSCRRRQPTTTHVTDLSWIATA